MKVAVASDDGNTIASHFGRARGFVVYEIDGSEVTNKSYLENTFTRHARESNSENRRDTGGRGAGCGAGLGAGHGRGHGTGDAGGGHRRIVEALRGCQAVITHGMGKHMYDDLRAVGIEAFIVSEVNVDEALGLFLKGALENHPEKGCDH